MTTAQVSLPMDDLLRMSSAVLAAVDYSSVRNPEAVSKNPSLVNDFDRDSASR